MATIYRTLTFTTASVAAAGSSSTNRTIVGNVCDIVKIKVVPSNVSAGELTSVFLYKRNTFSASDLVYSTTSFSGSLVDPIETDGITSTERNEGFVAKYEDLDAANQLHIKITNSGTVSRTFTVTITYAHAGDGSLVFIESFGAVGDGTTDDTAAFVAAIAAIDAAGSGSLFLSNGKTYKTTTTLNFNANNMTVFGNGAEILFQPTGPYVAGVNDRVVMVGDPFTIDSPVNITGATAIGATSFVAASTAGLAAGDWLVVYEIEPLMLPVPDVIAIDWVQISSIAGTTVNVLSPFRIAFPATHSITKFLKVTNVVSNVTIRDLRVRSTDTGNAFPGLSASYARDVTFINCTTAPAKGNAVYCYRCSRLTISNCFLNRGNGQASELAESVDVIFTGNQVGTFNVAPDTAALTLDMGLGFFSVTNNIFSTGANIMMQLLNGVHDGVVTGNTLCYVTSIAAYNCLGIASLGSQRVIVAHNILVGGGGASSHGISFGDTTGFTVDIESKANIIGPNIITNFTSRLGTRLDDDLYIGTYGNNEFEVNGALQVETSSSGTVFQAHNTGDAIGRYIVSNLGLTAWTDGTVGDLTLGRLSPGLLSTNKQFRAEGYLLFSGGTLSLANGANDNIALPTVSHVVISGPTGAFSVSGFTGGVDGRILYLLNNVAFAMTITNDATSTAANRIITLTGADVVLRAGKSYATFIYDSGLGRWVLVSTN